MRCRVLVASQSQGRAALIIYELMQRRPGLPGPTELAHSGILRQIPPQDEHLPKSQTTPPQVTQVEVVEPMKVGL